MTDKLPIQEKVAKLREKLDLTKLLIVSIHIKDLSIPQIVKQLSEEIDSLKRTMSEIQS